MDRRSDGAGRGESLRIDRLKSHVNLNNLTFVFSLVFFAWLVRYFYTGLGGAVELAARLIPVALVL
jgi:hypothetical protein